MIILLYGQPTSGKTTLAMALQKKLNNHKNVIFHLDGDFWRKINQNTGYDKSARLKNLHSAFNLALTLNEQGIDVIMSFVCPYREIIKEFSKLTDIFIEIYLHSNIDRGRTAYYVNDFEPPERESKCLKIDTGNESIEESLKKCFKYIIDKM